MTVKTSRHRVGSSPNGRNPVKTRDRMYNIREPDAIKASGMSQRSIAEAAHCSQRLVWALANGLRTSASEPVARSMADALDWEFEELWEPADRVAWERTCK